MAGQCKHIFTPLAQRGQAKANHVQPVVQVFTKHALFNALLQVLMGRRNHARIGFDGVVPADTVKMPVAQYPQQPRLQIKRHVANFIEKKRATLGLFKAATAHGLRTGKRPALMAKQFTFKQILRDGSGVDGHKRTIGA